MGCYFRVGLGGVGVVLVICASLYLLNASSFLIFRPFSVE